MDKEVSKKEADNSEKKYCKKCNLEITTKRRKIFCSVRCAKAFHSLKRYHKIKSTPEYKKKRNEYTQKKRDEEKGEQK